MSSLKIDKTEGIVEVLLVQETAILSIASDVVVEEGNDDCIDGWEGFVGA